MKKVISFITAVLIMLGSTIMAYIAPVTGVLFELLTVTANATETQGDFEYSVNNDGKTVTLTKYTGTGGNVEIPTTLGGKSVTRIHLNTFRDCTSLTSLTIPYTVTNIGYTELEYGTYDAFIGCTGLVKIDVDANNSEYSSVNGVLFNKDKTILIRYPLGNPAKKYVVPDSVTRIEYEAFDNCIDLTSITIPDSVTHIGNPILFFHHASFYGCTSLVKIDVDANNGNYSSVNGVLFDKDKTKLIRYPEGKADKSYVIPDSVTWIDGYAFYRCTGLTSITIPDSVSQIGRYYKDWNDFGFDGCTSLTAINVDVGNKNYCSENGILFNKDKTKLIRYPEGKAYKSYVIPDSVTSINSYAFENCTSLVSIAIPYSVTNIDNSAFRGCTSLTSVTISDSITSINYYAFENCTSLKDVYYAGTEEQWESIEIGEYNNNLTDAKIHFSSTGPDGTSVEIEIPKPAENAPEITNMQVSVIQSGDLISIIPIADDGTLDLSEVPDGEYGFTFSAKNCAPRAYNVTVANGTLNGLDDGVELHLYGDINGDGKINGTDVLKAKLLAKGGSTSDAYDRVVANVNKDSTVNGTDVLQLKLHAKGSKNLWQ